MSGTKETDPRTGHPGWRRQWALSERAVRAFEKRGLVRLGRASAWVVGAAYFGLMLYLWNAEGAAALPDVAVGALPWLSWSALVVAFGVANRDHDPSRWAGLEDLARLRGLSDEAIRAVETFAAARVVVRAVVPVALGVGVSALVLSTSLSSAAGRVGLSLAIVLAATFAAGLVGVMARWCTAISPRHPRWALVALVFVPHVVRDLGPDVPSVPAGVALLIQQLADLSERVG